MERLDRRDMLAELSRQPWLVRRHGAALLRQFLAGVHDDPRAHVARMARERAQDPHVRPAERSRLLRIAEQAERSPA
jgi:truncated hemoglobin YjbI